MGIVVHLGSVLLREEVQIVVLCSRGWLELKQKVLNAVTTVIQG